MTKLGGVYSSCLLDHPV